MIGQCPVLSIALACGPRVSNDDLLAEMLVGTQGVWTPWFVSVSDVVRARNPRVLDKNAAIGGITAAAGLCAPGVRAATCHKE